MGREAGGGVSFAMLVMLDWMGRSGYFNLGNSNSLASIDISKAYTGLTDYYPPVVGTFTLLITFTAPLLFVSCTGLRDFREGLGQVRLRLRVLVHHPLECPFSWCAALSPSMCDGLRGASHLGLNHTER